ncbi:MAG: ABC transporter substrate-binding protein [Alphaproteobacteria bacterium]|nr:ABC transporter substrate-binding protein [Alphaproteobacteria bacterium]
MKRRNFLKATASSLAAGVVAAPAIAQTQQPIRWRMATAWPRTLDAMHGSAEALCKRVGQLTEGRFEIRPFAAGEIVPPLQIFDAVQSNTVECGHVLSTFFIGKRQSFAFDAGIPFGLNARQQNAWLNYGGGLELMREVFKKDNVVQFASGNVGVQMGGFYRKEIKKVEDLSGLKMRIGGFGGTILAKLGAVPTQIPAGDIYTSLERGAIDAAEWIGPYDDEKLGLHKVAKFYYFPGWWEGSAQVTTLVNATAWERLPQAFKDAYDAASNEQNLLMLAKYDARNPEALKRLIAQGVQLREFPRAVMDACYKATQETMDEISAKDADFKKIYDSWRVFRDDVNAWFNVAESRLDNYRYRASASRRS